MFKKLGFGVSVLCCIQVGPNFSAQKVPERFAGKSEARFI
jgi:hypothetical protein